jgi:hypothetical protein
MTRIEELDKEIDRISAQYPADSEGNKAFVALGRLLFLFVANMSSKGITANHARVKEFIDSHKDTPTLHKDLVAQAQAFYSILAEVVQDIINNGGKGVSPTRTTTEALNV